MPNMPYQTKLAESIAAAMNAKRHELGIPEVSAAHVLEMAQIGGLIEMSNVWLKGRLPIAEE